MIIEIKEDQKLLKLLTDIKDALTTLTTQAPVKVDDKTQDKSMTVEAFVEDPTYTLEDVRAKLADIDSNKAKAIIKSFGVRKLTDIPEDKYPEVMQKAGEQ